MDSENLIPPITGLNLDNYFPTKCSYDSIFYVHKKFLPKYKNRLQKNYGTSKIKTTSDKCQQFNYEDIREHTYKVKETDKNNKNKHVDPVIEQTIKFAKSIIPYTIPPSADDSSHAEYTVKTTKKSKRIPTNLNNHKSESVKGTYNKDKQKYVYDDHQKRDKLKRPRDSISAGETVSLSQNNTLDDVNENRTLSCTLSEISERKHHKEDRHCKRNKRNEMQKVAISESFDAVATEFMNTTSDTKIKIHLMNERDKNLFCENIQMPVIAAIKDCIMELNNENLKAMQCIQTSIEHQTKKIEVILDKLSSFEEKFDFYKKENPSTIHTVPSYTTKTSKLEELSADLCDIHVKEMPSSDEEELGQFDLLNKNEQNRKYKGKNALAEGNHKFEQIMGCGEDVPVQSKTHTEVRLDKSNRIPARYCWTDAGRNK